MAKRLLRRKLPEAGAARKALLSGRRPSQRAARLAGRRDVVRAPRRRRYIEACRTDTLIQPSHLRQGSRHNCRELASMPAPRPDLGPPEPQDCKKTCSETQSWTAGLWSFPAVITVTGWVCHRDYAVRSERCIRSPNEVEPRCSLYANPPSFRGHPQGSGTSGRSDIPPGTCC